jgi:hypothetical protein
LAGRLEFGCANQNEGFPSGTQMVSKKGKMLSKYVPCIRWQSIMLTDQAI